MINSLRPEFVPWFILNDSIGAIRTAYAEIQSFCVTLAHLILFCGDALVYDDFYTELMTLIFACFPEAD